MAFIRILQSFTLSLIISFCLPLVSTAQSASSIRSQIDKRLDSLVDLGNHRIEVSIFRGRVTLSGEVESEEIRSRVERVILGVDGVSEVENFLEIKKAGDVGTDSYLAHTIVNAIESSFRRVPFPYHIEVTARQGAVELTGRLGTREDAERVEQIARTVSGVTEVGNSIQIQAKSSDESLLQEINQAVPSSSLCHYKGGMSFSVVQGVATVRGSADEHRELDCVLATILNIPGIKDIRSEVVLAKGIKN